MRIADMVQKTAPSQEDYSQKDYRKLIVELNQDTDEGTYKIELMVIRLHSADHNRVRNELEGFGNLVVLHENTDSIRLQIEGINHDIVPELLERGWHWE